MRSSRMWPSPAGNSTSGSATSRSATSPRRRCRVPAARAALTRIAATRRPGGDHRPRAGGRRDSAPGSPRSGDGRPPRRLGVRSQRQLGLPAAGERHAIERSWWHDLAPDDGGSGNGVLFGAGGGRSVTIRANTCDQPVSVSPASAAGPVRIAGTGSSDVAVVVEGNWLTGGNNTVECNGHGSMTGRQSLGRAAVPAGEPLPGGRRQRLG